MRTIADDLDGLSLQAWATTAYLITSTVSTPIYGKLGDLFGRRPLFLVAILIFVIGSVTTGFATTMYELAAFRALQGIGAGGLFSLALTIVADIVVHLHYWDRLSVEPSLALIRFCGSMVGAGCS
jgi:MFS family permease